MPNAEWEPWIIVIFNKSWNFTGALLAAAVKLTWSNFNLFI